MINFKKNHDEIVKETLPTLEPSVEMVDGRKVLVYKERVKDPNEGLSYNDFSLQSLLDADAIDLLQPTAPISASQLSAADTANSVASAIGVTADNVKSDDEPENK